MKEKSSRNGRSRIPWFWALSNILDGPFRMDRLGAVCRARAVPVGCYHDGSSHCGSHSFPSQAP